MLKLGYQKSLFENSYKLRLNVLMLSNWGELGRWWAEKDSNLRRREPADLQSAPFDRFGIYPGKSWLVGHEWKGFLWSELVLIKGKV